jgi:PAS domain S-box-containing protein
MRCGRALSAGAAAPAAGGAPSDAVLAAAVRHGAEAVALVAADGTLLYASPATTRLWGYTTDTFLGRSGDETLHPDDRAQAAALFAQLLERPGGIVRAEFRVRHRDGSWRWTEEIACNLLEEPSLRAVVVSRRDATARKQAEEALRASEARYRQLVDAAADTVYSLQPDGRITSLNPAFEATTGWARIQWLGRPFDEILHPEDVDSARQGFAQVLRGETVQLAELRVRRPDDTYLVGEFSVAPRTEAGTLVEAIGFARDVTRRRAAEAALREARQEVDRLEGITLVARELAHLLNNDLVVPVGLVELLQTGRCSPADLPDLADAAATALTAAARHVQQFQQVVRVTTKETPLGLALDLERSTGQPQAKDAPSSR